MDAFIPGDPAHHGMCDDGASNKPDDGSSWYISRKEIEEDSPSKRDGIDLKRETYLRKSYCTFLQDLGMRLKVPQVTIATAIIFCHRFFLRHSHAKNDRRTIATVCMFLAGKVEETPRPLKDVILVSYEIIHKKDPAAVQRIKQKEVYEEQKELILVGERLVLATLAFDFNVHHPYKPLVEAIKKFKVAQNALAQVAWNFVNDGLRTSLCLQFKPHHIAAGAIFLAAKFLKVKLPSDGERVWWQEFDVTPRQLEEVSNQMLELYEQNRVPPAQGGSEMEGSAGGGTASHRGPSKTPTANEDHTSTAVKPTTSKPYADTHGGVSRTTKSGNDEYATEEVKSSMNKGPDGKILENQPNKGESQHTRSGLEEFGNERDKNVRKQEKIPNRDPDLKETIGQSPRDAIKRLDKDKVKAALAQTRKFRTGMTRKPDNMDEDDLIAREIEDGIELAVESDKIKKERRQNWSKQQSSNRHEDETSHQERREVEHIEEGEVSAIDNAGRSSPSPKSVHCKRKAENSPDQNRLGYPTY